MWSLRRMAGKCCLLILASWYVADSSRVGLAVDACLALSA